MSSTGSASPNLAEAQDAAPSDPAPPDQSSPELTTDVASTAKAAAAEVDQQQPQQNGDPQASLATPPAEPAEQLQSGLAAVEEDLGQLQAEADQAAESAEAVEGEAELEETELTPAEIRYQAEQAGLAEEASRQAEQKPVGVGDELLPQLLVGSQPAADQQPAQDQGFPELIDMSAEFDRYLELEEQQQQQQQQGLQLPAVDTDVDALPTRSSTAAQPGPVEGSEAAEPEPLPVEAATDLQPSTEQPDEATDGSPPDTEKPGEDGSSQGSRPSGLPPGLAQGVQEESEVVSALRRQVCWLPLPTCGAVLHVFGCPVVPQGLACWMPELCSGTSLQRLCNACTSTLACGSDKCATGGREDAQAQQHAGQHRPADVQLQKQERPASPSTGRACVANAWFSPIR